MLDLSRTAPTQRWLVPAFFGVVLLLGLLLYRSYGLSLDENQQRDIGMISLKHVGQKVAPVWVANDTDFDRYNTPLDQFYDRDYGVAFETPVCLAERLLGIDDGGNKFRFRHLCTFLVCFGGLIALFQLVRRRFDDWRLGLLGASWLLLSPRMFAESFYNDKDAVFMALFLIATNTAVQLLLRPTARHALWHALACAITIDVRVMGILLPMATVGLLLWRAVRGEISWRRWAGISAGYVVVLTGLVVAFWPYLWPAPLTNFLAAYEHMKTFRWNGVMLYRGEFVASVDLPWHYVSVWIGITTPLLYLGAGLLGIGLVLRQLMQNHWRLWRDEGGMQDVLFLALLLGPLGAVIAFHSVLYDGWRQLYFVYPALLLLGLRGWVALARWRPRWTGWPRTVYAVTVLSLLITAGQIIRDHPLQNVYFNLLAGNDVEHRFEMDYWGTGYRKDLEYIVGHDARPRIKVMETAPEPAKFNALMLPPADRDRLVFVDKADSADYIVTNYRWHPQDFEYPFEVHNTKVGGVRVHSVFRQRANW